jgi:hypothetical protein
VRVAETRSKTRAERGPGARGAGSAAGETGEPTPLVCNVAFCPICLAVTAAQGVAPDAMEHLLNAAREFFLAARSVIDQRADDLDGAEGARPTRLERIDVG